jgi:hypothetical protein
MTHRMPTGGPRDRASGMSDADQTSTVDFGEAELS